MASRDFIHRTLTGAAAVAALYLAFTLTFGEGGLLDPSLPTDFTIDEDLPHDAGLKPEVSSPHPCVEAFCATS